jgi:hypothetical protein
MAFCKKLSIYKRPAFSKKLSIYKRPGETGRGGSGEWVKK